MHLQTNKSFNFFFLEISRVQEKNWFIVKFLISSKNKSCLLYLVYLLANDIILSS